MSLLVGTRLGPYEILAPLGAGGMGEVYRARDTRLDRTVAIKVLPSSVASEPDRRARFEREAKTISALSHPHICALHDVGEQDGVHFIVMEYLEGDTLARRIERGALPIEEVLRVGVQIADALDKAHRHGIVHRDLKPANVMLTKSGSKLLDFGLAKAPTASAWAAPQLSQMPTGEKPLTSEGTLLGTFQYMAPEQLEGRDADHRADIWALGCVLYEMATGRRPFAGKSQASLIGSILREDPPPPSSLQPLTPPALDRVIRACLAKDPDERWQSAHDVMSELRWIAEERLQSQSAPRSGALLPVSSRRAWLAAALVAGIALAFGAWQRWGESRPSRPAIPVIVLMDSPHPLRVYDPQTLKSGGTNADDLSDLLRDLPVALVKENTGPSWHRENEVLRQDPDLILVHRSCFYVPSDRGDEAFEREFYERSAAEKLDLFIGYVGLGNPRTKFLVYSRRGFLDPADRDRWRTGMEKRFPPLKGRLSAWMVPLGRATFRHPVTGGEIKQQVSALLRLKP